jgi:hypothetical protein
MMAAHSYGTRVTGGIDVQKLGNALKRPGMDPRVWISEGTVGTLDPETGEMDFTDRHAIWNDSGGVHVDVELQPSGWHTTARYAPAQAGEATISGPIRPGDIVLVEFPNGNTSGGVITKILQSRSKRQPVDQGKPIFNNNRLLIHAKTVPIDVRTAEARVLLEQDGTVAVTGSKSISLQIPGGPQVLIEQDGTVTVKGTRVIVDSQDVRLGGAAAIEPLILGTTRTAAEATELAALIVATGLLEAASVGPLVTLLPGFSALTAAFTAFAAALPTTLSPVSKTQ